MGTGAPLNHSWDMDFRMHTVPQLLVPLPTLSLQSEKKKEKERKRRGGTLNTQPGNHSHPLTVISDSCV